MVCLHRPRTQNEDYLLLKPGETRRIPLAAGNLVRLWSTASQPEKIVLALQNAPNSARIDLWRDNKAWLGNLYQKAFTLYPGSGTPAPVRVLKSGAALIATNRDTEPNKWFYQAAVRPDSKRKAAPGKVDGFTKAVSSDGANALPGEATRLDTAEAVSPVTQLWFDAPFQHTIKAGEKKTFWQTRGGGHIGTITIACDSKAPEAWRALRLRAVWDGGKQAAVDVPLLSLCGSFFGTTANVNNSFCSFDGRTLSLDWPMPFGSGARLSLVNSGSQAVAVRGRIMAYPWTSPYRFCAAYGSARAQKGKPVQMLNVRGAGAFVGLALGIKPTVESSRRAFAYLEGNEIITADGVKFEGTGAEDFFNSAWYFPEAPFLQSFHGLTWKQKLPPQVAAYRLMIADAVPFERELNFAFGHGSSNNSDDLEYRWAAFWYQKPPLNFQIADELEAAATDAVAGRTQQPNRDATQRSNAIWLALGFIIVAIVAGFVATSSRRKTQS